MVVIHYEEALNIPLPLLLSELQSNLEICRELIHYVQELNPLSFIKSHPAQQQVYMCSCIDAHIKLQFASN